MERGFLSQIGSGGGVKEKRSNVSDIEVVKDGAIPSVMGDSGNAAMEVELPYVVDDTVAKKNQSLVVNTTSLKSYPPLPTRVTTSAGNALGKSSYANVTGKPCGKKLNIHTLFTPGGNRIDVVVPVESIRALSEQFANTVYGFFMGKRVVYPIVANYVRNTWGKYGLVRSMSSYARAMIELRADVKLKDNIVVAMPKIKRVGHYICIVYVEYEWKPHSNYGVLGEDYLKGTHSGA
ncbi:hypothetical protein Tco_0733708 [Tanacetum coccineum]